DHTHLKLEKLCGEGIQYRSVICTEVKAKSIDCYDKSTMRGGYCSVRTKVSDTLCNTQKPELYRRCTKDCHQDCKLHSWGRWSSECLDGICVMQNTETITGHRIRRRTIAIQPSTHGRKCPHLMESSRCQYPLCFSWAYDEFGDCIVDPPFNKTTGSVVCQHGLKWRKVFCSDHNMVKQMLQY
ncbi:unnamed protein product, partial [Owenia fusiformis]